MLSKDTILEYYNSFFRRFPQKGNISGVIKNLQRYDVAHKLNCQDSSYKGILISKEYLIKEDVDGWSDLPEYLSVQELRDLDNQHGNNLRWRLLDSTVTDKQIDEYKQRWNIDLPEEFEVFLKSYANLLCEVEISSTMDVVPIRLKLPLMLWNNEMYDFNIDVDIEIIRLLSDFGYILIATKNDYEWWLLDSQSGKVISYTDDADYSDLDDGCDKENLFDKHGFVQFENFNDFLQACFLSN